MSGNENNSGKKRKVRARKYGPESFLENSYSPMQVPQAPTSEFSSPRPRGRGRGQFSTGPQDKQISGAPMESSLNRNNIFQISIDNGEDICSKIRSTATNMHQNISIISANGYVSKVTIQQDDPLKTVKYEGKFGIKILSGIIFHAEVGKGGMSTMLARLDGHTITGLVSSELIANGSVKVLASCF